VPRKKSPEELSVDELRWLLVEKTPLSAPGSSGALPAHRTCGFDRPDTEARWMISRRTARKRAIREAGSQSRRPAYPGWATAAGRGRRSRGIGFRAF